MKYFKILAILMLSSVISFYSCSDTADASKDEAKESVEVTNSPTQPNVVTPNVATSEPAQNADGVWHYTCGKGCAGGAGTAGNCTTCGGPLAHNKAYHPNTPQTATPTSPSVTAPSVTAPAAEPAQNAAGVWHYTCGSGCAGGAGTAGACGTCGGALAHNQAYHQ